MVVHSIGQSIERMLSQASNDSRQLLFYTMSGKLRRQLGTKVGAHRSTIAAAHVHTSSLMAVPCGVVDMSVPCRTVWAAIGQRDLGIVSAWSGQVLAHGANCVLGYRQHFDLEGSQLVCRGCAPSARAACHSAVESDQSTSHLSTQGVAPALVQRVRVRVCAPSVARLLWHLVAYTRGLCG